MLTCRESSGIRRRATRIFTSKTETTDHTDRIRGFYPCDLWLNLLLSDRGVRLVTHEMRRVVLDELLQIAVSPARVEVVLLHLGVDLIVVPVVMIEAINRAHHARAMTPASTVYVELSSRGIVHQLQKLLYLHCGRVILVAHRNVHVLHSESFGVPLFICFRI